MWALTSWHGAQFTHLGVALVPQLLLRLASITVIHTLARYRRGCGRVNTACAAAYGAVGAKEEGRSSDTVSASCVEDRNADMGRMEGLDGEATLKGLPELDGAGGSVSVSRLPSNQQAGASTAETSRTGGSGSRSRNADMCKAWPSTPEVSQVRHTYTAAAEVVADGDAARGHTCAGPCDTHAAAYSACANADVKANPFLPDRKPAHQLPDGRPQQQPQYPGLLLAGRPPSYRSVVRRRTMRIKLPFAEPEQLSPGFTERLQDVAAQQGVMLAGVYVRPGEVTLKDGVAGAGPVACT